MELMSDRGRRVTVEELNTSRLLAHARQQAHKRKFDDMLIVDVDAHHYENEHMKDILPFMENDVLRQLSMAQGMKELRRRIRGISSIQKITRAMEMVATTRLRRAQLRAEGARPFAETKNLTELLKRLEMHRRGPTASQGNRAARRKCA